MEWSRDRGLVLRMAVALTLLGGMACAFTGVVYGIVVALLQVIESESSSGSVWIGFLVTGIVITMVGYRKYSSATLGLRFTKMLPTQSTTERSDALQRIVEQLAHQADLPVPRVVVTESSVPTSYTTGLTPDRATIVVTSTLLDTLNAEELRAVFAHELTHIKHRDMAVMTVASIPLMITRSIKDWADEQRKGKYDWVGVGACYIVSSGLWLLGRLLVRSLSRYRELAADRGAVALTGSPAALASAITKLSKQSDEFPAEDLRGSSVSIEVFSIVPIDTPVNEPIRLGPDGDRIPNHYKYTYRLQKLTAPLFTTHPPTNRRLDRLREIEREI